MTGDLRSLACALLAIACSGERTEPSGREAEPTEDEVVVFAAASLREVFAEMESRFRSSHHGVRVTFNFAGTQELRTQLEHGARADVFASADQRHMIELGAQVVEPRVFARNEPVMVVARERAQSIRTFADLPSAERIVIGVPEVPIGRYTLQIFERASASLGSDFRSRVEAHVVSRELNVRQVLAKVALGEADAGIVYRSDTRAAPGPVTVVTIPPEANVIAEYPIAVLREAEHPSLARAWVDLVVSADGRRMLEQHGFLSPDAAPP
jgi:molybdate transport system substrate-binding protein